MVAKSTPGMANTIWISVPSALLIPSTMGAAHPMRPKVMIYARPAMTGEMEKGISISVDSTCFPLKENLVSAQDATSPNRVLTRTAAKVASTVTLNAELTNFVPRDCI